MLLLKQLIIISAVLIMTSLGLLETSTNYTNLLPLANAPVKNKQTSESQVKEDEISDEFLQLRKLIENENINKTSIRQQIALLNDRFEKTYLSALLSKREGNYDQAFKQLYSLLSTSPNQLSFYETLANLAKMSGNISSLIDWLHKDRDTTNLYHEYLSAVIDYQKGKIFEAVNKFNSISEKGFTSKELFFDLANAWRSLGDYGKSLFNLLEAQKLCDNDDPFISKIINLKGTLYFLSGDYEKAQNVYESALATSKKNDNRIEEIKSIANLAIIKDQYGEVDAARDDFNRTIKMSMDIENNELLAFLYSEIGVSYSFTSNLIEARENYEKSLSLYQKMSNDERLSYLSSNIGSIFLQILNYQAALDYYTRGIKYSGENKLGQILNLTGLADVYSNESNYSKALEYYKRAKEISDSIKDISSSVKIDQGIGALYYNINRPFNSLEILKKAESEFSKNDMPFEAVRLYSKIGVVLSSIDSLKEAEEYFSKGLNLSENIGDIYNSLVLKTELANNYLNQGRNKEAEKLLGEVEKSSKEYELTQLVGLQNLYWSKIFSALTDYKKAVEKLKISYNLSGTARDFNTQIEAGYLLAKNYKEMGDINNAEKWFINTINIVERISTPLSLNQDIQIAHFSGVDDVYNSLADLYLDQGRADEAFKIIEKSRSRNTKANLDKLKLLAELKDEKEYTRLIDLEWMVKSRLYNSYTTDSLQNLFNNVKSEITSKNQDLAQIIEGKHILNLADMQTRLAGGEYLISIYVGRKGVTIFKLTNANMSYRTIELSRDSLKTMLGRISPIYKTNSESEEIYVNDDLFSFNAYASYKFYKALFSESFADIPKESTLIISLPAELVKMPVEMLVTEWNDGQSPYFYDNKKFLIQDFQILYTPSASIYFLQKEKLQKSTGENLLVGDPFISNSDFHLTVRSGIVDAGPAEERNVKLFPLAYSKEEINSIDGTISNNMVLLSKDATESNFKKFAPSSTIVHISSHSFLLKDRPLILFSNQEDEKNDGFLELGEIVQLNLNSELIVLSSCRSGLGKLDEAEGIIGMQKAFFEAGSKSVLVSLWDVNDKYTARFMNFFYKHLADGKSKSLALRLAKLDFIKTFSSNPYYWSAFVLAGNPSSIMVKKTSSSLVLYLIGLLFIIVSLYVFVRKTKTN